MGAPDPIQAVLHTPSIQLLGEVVAQEPASGQYIVRSADCEWFAHRAASCLVVPLPGDEVLLSGPTSHQVYLIAVTRQRNPGTTRIAVAGDMHFASSGGQISMQADTLAFAGARELSMKAPQLDVRADEARCTFQSLDYLGERARVGVDQVSVVGRVCEVVMDRLSQLANSVFRLTRDVEQSRAGKLDYQAEHTIRLHAQHTLLTARDLVKVDADQIHMG